MKFAAMLRILFEHEERIGRHLAAARLRRYYETALLFHSDSTIKTQCGFGMKKPPSIFGGFFYAEKSVYSMLTVLCRDIRPWV